ncbi:DinB family protein [Hymenobacter volaticus]|uniref:DinB family protein n=1 Tax=Hymenobacter volaticus TaxID=2932254 RepID=A0ABY4G1K6_9BACT|nr:DinB family protein [Hymenobacter volaticus]UOQ64752.1 DinB family protein [Hymenobacter volaticus]
MLTDTLAPLAQTLVAELDDELQTTRRVLARAPEAHFSWQPHPKSMTLGHLTSHITDLMGGIAHTLHTTEVDLAHFLEQEEHPATTTAELLLRLDTNGAAARDALSIATPDDFEQLWTMRHGDQVLMTNTRAEVVRHLISHMAHHRGQLSVYLRLLDVPVPAIYGPSADEQMFQG